MGRKSRRQPEPRKVHLHALTSPAPVEFTDGVPAGAQADQFWRDLLLYLEQDVAQGGWDQPALLFGLSDPATCARELEEHVTQLQQATQASAPGQAVTVFSAELIAEIDTAPFNWLVGQRASEPYMAVVLVSESWMARVSDPALNHLPPSKRPDRVEVRILTAVTRTGRVFSLMRERGEQPKLMPTDMQMAGRIVDALRRYLQAPLPDCQFEPGDLFGRFVLRSMLVALGALHDRDHEHPALQMLRTLAGNDEQLRSRLLSAAALSTVQGLVRAALPSRRAATLAEALEAAAHVDDDQIGTDSAGPLLADVGSALLAAVSWDELPYQAGLLKALDVDPQMARWMGPTMLANDVTGELPGQKMALELFDELEDGEALRGVALRTLSALGWLYPESDDVRSGEPATALVEVSADT